MKPIDEAARKAARHRKFHWCRRENGFSDMPVWRVVAQQCNLPLYQVLALVNRLEELANAAANFGGTRGSVERFDAAEFGAALGMATEEAARIYAALEDEKVRWITYSHVATFYDRNPDREDDRENANERKRRERTRKKIRECLARLAGQGKIGEAERGAIEISLKGLSDTALGELLVKLSRAELSPVTVSQRDIRDMGTNVDNFSTPSEVNGLAPSRRHVVTSRDIVTVTPEQSTVFKEAAGDKSGDGARGETVGLASLGLEEQLGPVAEATRWLEGEGLQLLVDHIQIRTQLAQIYLERWRRDLQDDVVLKQIIAGADGAGYIGARFHTLITDGVKRAVIKKHHGPQLPLMPPRPGQRRESA